MHVDTPAVTEQISDERLAEMLAAVKTADAWMHPTADWVHKSHGYVLPHCAKGGPRPLPLYQIDADALRSLLTELQQRRASDVTISAEIEHVEGDALSRRREAEAGNGGWVLVPREPTLDMVRAGWKAILEFPDEELMAMGVVDLRANVCYAAMLAASPSSPASGVRVKATHQPEDQVE